MKSEAARLLKNLVLMGLGLGVASVAVESFFRPADATVWHWLLQHPLSVLVNAALVSMLGVFVLAITGRAMFSAAVAAGFIGLLALTHASTLSTLGRPLFPWELLLVRQAANIWPYATAKYGAFSMLLGGVLLVVTLGATFRSGQRFTWRPRVLLGAAVVLVAMWLFPRPGESLKPLGIVHKHWAQLDNYRENGLPLAFLMNLPAANVKTPQTYSRERVQEVLGRYTPALGTGERPDIVVVMSESFFDVTRLPGVKYEKDPLPNLHRLQSEAASGSLYTPLFGGGTANTEFEVLTGDAMRWLPRGSVPYQQYVKRPVPALPRLFAERGYRTSAAHIFHRWFWDRETVYPLLGFERFVSMESVSLEKNTLFYPGDDNLTAVVKREIEAAEQPLFLFAVSVEAHGPYEPSRYPGPSVHIDGPLDDAARAELGTYTDAISHADHELGELLRFLQMRQRPALLVFFGDHLPSLPKTLNQTGVLEAPEALRDLAPAQRAFLYQVPVVLWSNRQNQPRDLGGFSANFLGPAILREAGIAGTPYTGFLDAARAQFPVVTPTLLSNSRGEWLDEEPPELKALRDEWYLIEYDGLFGDGFATGETSG